MREHRFLPVMPAAGQVWVGSESRRAIRLTGPAAAGASGDPMWNCELLSRQFDGVSSFDLHATGENSTISEWQLSWFRPTDQQVIEPGPTYKSQAAREAQASGYGGESYWNYLDEHAQRTHDYFMRHGDPDKAAAMFTQSLGEALMGNDGV